LVLKEPRKLSVEESGTLTRLRGLQLGVLILRIVLAMTLIATLATQFARTLVLPLVVVGATLIVLFALRRYIEPFYTLVEGRFLRNLNAKERAEVESLTRIPQLAPWNATLARLNLASDSRIAGQTLEEARFRSGTGATVAMIDRGHRRIFAPSRSERLWPNDEVYLIGTDEQIAAAQRLMEPLPAETAPPPDDHFSLESVEIRPDSPYAGRTIREIGMGESFGALIVGIERAGQRMLNPDSSVRLEPGDLVWTFGRRDRIRELRRGEDLVS
jgi:CPA2 family monovalent cation:H+ antiporter-2